MDRRESIKAIAASLAAAAAGTGVAVHASHPVPDEAQNETQETLIERMRRKLKPLEAKGFELTVAMEWNLCRAEQWMSVFGYEQPIEGEGFCWAYPLYTKREAIQQGNAKSLETLAKWRVDTLAWQILDHFGIEGNHGPT